MSVWSVPLPFAGFTIEAPAEVEPLLRQFFPGATAAASNDAGRRYAMRVSDAWTVVENGAVLGRFAGPAYALAAVEDRCIERSGRSAEGFVAFHGGAVDVGGSACLVAGEAETGKTATTVQLVELGHVFLADEVARVGSPGDLVHPFHRAPAVGASFVADRFGSSVAAHGTLVEPAAGMRRYVPRRLGADPVRVADLLLPRYRPRAATELVELGAGEALTEVLGYCFEPEGDPEWVVDALIGQLGRWSIRRLVYGEAAAAREALAGLFPTT